MGAAHGIYLFIYLFSANQKNIQLSDVVKGNK